MNKQNKIYIVFYDTKLKYCINNKFGSVSFASLKNSKIIDIKLFEKELSNFIHTNGINNSLFGDWIYYLSVKDNFLELSLIKEILHKFSFKNTIIIDALEILKDKDYIIVFDEYYILIYNNKKYEIPKLYPNIIKTILTNLKVTEIYVIGNEKNSSQMDNAYYLYTPQDTLLTKLKRHITNSL